MGPAGHRRPKTSRRDAPVTATQSVTNFGSGSEYDESVRGAIGADSIRNSDSIKAE